MILNAITWKFRYILFIFSELGAGYVQNKSTFNRELLEECKTSAELLLQTNARFTSCSTLPRLNESIETISYLLLRFKKKNQIRSHFTKNSYATTSTNRIYYYVGWCMDKWRVKSESVTHKHFHKREKEMR